MYHIEELLHLNRMFFMKNIYAFHCNGKQVKHVILLKLPCISCVLGACL